MKTLHDSCAQGQPRLETFTLVGITCSQIQYFKSIAELITAHILPLSSKVQTEKKGLANMPASEDFYNVALSVSLLFASKLQEKLVFPILCDEKTG